MAIIEASGTARATGVVANILPKPALHFKKLALNAIVPSRAHEGDAGLDLHALYNLILSPYERRVVDTGIAVSIPRGFVGLVCPRSGLAAEYGVTIVNAPGIIDFGYTNAIKVILLNTGEDDFVIKEGDRIAQLVVTPILELVPVEVSKFEITSRGDSGLGSTGR